MNTEYIKDLLLSSLYGSIYNITPEQLERIQNSPIMRGLMALWDNVGFATPPIDKFYPVSLGGIDAVSGAAPQLPSYPADTGNELPPVGQNGSTGVRYALPPVGQTGTANYYEDYLPPVRQKYRVQM